MWASRETSDQIILRFDCWKVGVTQWEHGGDNRGWRSTSPFNYSKLMKWWRRRKKWKYSSHEDHTVHFWKCKQGFDSWYSDTNLRAKISSTRYFDPGANKVKCSLIWWEPLTGDLTNKIYVRLFWHILTFNRNEDLWLNIIFKGYSINFTHSNAACNLLQWCYSVDNSYVDSWFDTMLLSCFELWLDKVMSEGGRCQQRVIKYTHRVFWRPTSLGETCRTSWTC